MLLDRLLQAAASEGVGRVMIWANGLTPDQNARLTEVVAHVQGPEVEVIASPVNIGSAAGYARLIEEARARPQISGIWFLDDDNLPRAGSLAHLVAISDSRGGAATSAVRSDRR